MICLTVAFTVRHYSPENAILSCSQYDMTDKCKEADSPAFALKDETARQRWELFHRAIAHAKRCNDDALTEAEEAPAETGARAPFLTIIR